MPKQKQSLAGEFSGWKIGTEYICHTTIVDAEGHTVAATSCDYRRGANQDEYDAREFRLSRLLLSAPDLLAALEALLNSKVVQGHGVAIRDEAKRKGLGDPMELASAALHKAKAL